MNGSKYWNFWWIKKTKITLWSEYCVYPTPQPPKKSHGEALTPSVAVLGARASNLRLNEVIKRGPDLIGSGSLQEESLTPVRQVFLLLLSLPQCTRGSVSTQGDRWWRPTSQGERGLRMKPPLQAPWSWTSFLASRLEREISVVKTTQHVAICCSSPSRLRQGALQSLGKVLNRRSFNLFIKPKT